MGMNDQTSMQTSGTKHYDASTGMKKQSVVMPESIAAIRKHPSSTTNCTSPAISQSVKKTPRDYIFGKLIGEGSFSTVYLAKDVNSDKEYAIKVCDKIHIAKERKIASIFREREVLNTINHKPSPFFVKLFCTFHDAARLYFVLTYAKCGELLPYIRKVGSFDEQCTKFYSAEIILALEHLHKLGIIHRDLKPENILLSESMHILITDFGSAKIMGNEPKEQVSYKDKSGADLSNKDCGDNIDARTEINSDGDSEINEEEDQRKRKNKSRKNSFVGTAEYVSPEVLSNVPASKSSDLWALGCIIFQMVSGLPPFLAPNQYLIFKKILSVSYEFPDGFSSLAKDIVKKLLVRNPAERLGFADEDDYVSLKSHKLFEDIEWHNLHEQTPPPIRPYLPGTKDNEELRSQYSVPSNLEPGLDDKQMTRLLGLELHDEDDESTSKPEVTRSKPKKRKCSILELTSAELCRRVAEQSVKCPWHRFVQGNLIIKQGLVDKRKGLFARRRMLLLTTGPRLFYVDPANMVFKGEIPWSPELRPEPKSFKIFFVHTPNRTYYLEDPQGFALEWCRIIDEVRKFTYSNTS